MMAIGTMLAAFPGTRRRRADRSGVGTGRSVRRAGRRPAVGVEVTGVTIDGAA